MLLVGLAIVFINMAILASISHKQDKIVAGITKAKAKAAAHANQQQQAIDQSTIQNNEPV